MLTYDWKEDIVPLEATLNVVENDYGIIWSIHSGTNGLTQMFRKAVLIRQKAKIIRSLSLAFAFGIATFSILFIPYVYGVELVWFCGLFAVSFILVRTTVGFRSWITETGGDNRLLCVADDHSNNHACIPFDDITHVEVCEYSLWRITRAPEAYIDRPYHRIYTQFGYTGPGLIVCYNLPGHIGDDPDLRSWQLPAPRAEEFLAVLREKSSVTI